jgi:hypothetical protein
MSKVLASRTFPETRFGINAGRQIDTRTDTGPSGLRLAWLRRSHDRLGIGLSAVATLFRFSRDISAFFDLSTILEKSLAFRPVTCQSSPRGRLVMTPG